MIPPHLPPKSSNIKNHHQWQRLKLLLAVAVFGLLAGMSGASMMLGWIWPRFAEGDTWITSYANPGLSRAQLEERVRQEISSRIVAVHKGSNSLSGVNYLNKKIGDGIMLSSDGWLAMYQPNYDGNYKNMYVVAADGQVRQPESAVLDKYSGILYVKISAQGARLPDGQGSASDGKDSVQFKVVGFSDENSSLEDIFIWQNSNWYHGAVLYPAINYQIPHLDSAPLLSYSLNSSFNFGGVAINSQGRVVGFINEKNSLLPSFYITRILPKVLSRQTLSYPSLGVDGWFSEEQTLMVAKEKIQGFLVTSVWSAASPLRRGDVLMEINGRVVAADNLWYIISSNQTVKVKVLRGGKQIEVTVKVVQTK